MAAEILTWLSTGRNREQGIALLEKFGGSPFLVAQIRKHNSDFFNEKLHQALLVISKTGQARDKTPKYKASADKLKAGKLPEVLAFKEKHWRDLFAQMSSIHSKLKAARSKSTRYKYVVQILDLDDQIYRIWDELEHFEKTGQLMAPAGTEMPQDALSMARQIENLKNYIRREKRNKNKVRQNKFEHQLQFLQQQLKQVNG
jgi:hypothetical protein